MLGRNMADVREVAHRLAGTIAAVSTEAGVTASELEDEAERGYSAAISELFERLARQTHGIVEALGGVSIDGLRAHAGGAAPRQ